jgi:hypothetical protein
VTLKYWKTHRSISSKKKRTELFKSDILKGGIVGAQRKMIILVLRKGVSNTEFCIS